jgi:multimeric flavodoxin WrbA
MKILVINGSPRSRGNTMKVVSRIEEQMKQLSPEETFEYVHLGQVSLELCRGCYQCLALGEDRCPIKDARAELEQKMREADALVFACPHCCI